MLLHFLHFGIIIKNSKSVAIYCYIENSSNVYSYNANIPTISLQGPYITTDKRHFAQKSWYTISTKYNAKYKKTYFCPHKEVFDLGKRSQDIIIKIVIPIKERKKALLDLSDFNINPFTLYQSEDSLVKAMELKVFDLD